MTLEAHLGKLSKVSKRGIRVPKAYDQKTLVETVVALDELSTADMRTEKGLKAYQTHTGRNPKVDNGEEVDYHTRKDVSAGFSFLDTYAHAHFGKLAETLDEKTQLDLAFRYSPEGAVKSGSKAYDAARTKIADAKKEERRIREDPNEFMKDEIKKSSPFAVPFMIANSEEYRGIMQRKATQTGIAQILKYEGGAKKYLGDTESHITNMSREFPKILDDLEGLKEKTTRAAMRIVGRALNVHEENIALKELREEEASLQIDYAAVDTLNKLRQETMGKTVSLSLQKAAAKKAKEETRNREEGSSERSPETIKWGYLPGGDETENLTGKPSREKIEEFKELIKSRLEEMIRISRAAA